MLSFESDYNNGCHPRLLQAIIDTNNEILTGYGEDELTKSAQELIKKEIQCPNATIKFFYGGTQTNQFVISSLLRPYEGVISPSTGHINLHEAGAIEFTSHKVLSIPSVNGKISAEQIRSYLIDYFNDGSSTHIVRPGMVYLSYPTEYGTLYSKEELKEIHELCNEYDIPLYIDGARLAYGLAGSSDHMTLSDLASLCDIFYIGGTKCGALCGEAICFVGKYVPVYLVSQIKQHGALMAKGRLVSAQFKELFTNNLYLELGRLAINMSKKLIEIFKEKNYQFYLDSPTNQQFIVLENTQMELLKKNVCFSFWEKYDATHTVVRFATSWNTTLNDLIQLNKYL